MLNWDHEVDLGLSTLEKKLDIFFQPGLSWVKGSASSHSPKGIALFFLENDINKVETDPTSGNTVKTGMDFQVLVKSMLRWFWEVDRNSSTDSNGNIITTADSKSIGYFKELHQKFKENPFEYVQFDSFLRKNFVFRIQEPTQGLEGTIFPMFPMLTLEVGKPSNPVLPSNVSESGIQAGLGNMTAQFAFDHIFDPAPSDEESARDYIFEDYGQLLLRTALQELIEYLPAPSPSNENPSTTMDSVIASMEADNFKVFNNLAGVVSRFLLHGLRLPVVGQLAEKGVYEATGQQFNLSLARDTNASDPKPYVIKLSRPPAQSSFLTFVHPTGSSQTAASLEYEIALSESIDNPKLPFVALINGFEELASHTNPLGFTMKNGEIKDDVISLMPFYRNQKRIFSMHKWVQLDRPDSNPDPNAPDQFTFLLQIPAGLQQFVTQKVPRELAKFSPKPTDLPKIGLYSHSPDRSQRRENPLQDRITNTDYDWAAQIDVLVRQVPRDEAEGFLPGVFELADISESQINLLESVIKNAKPAEISMQLLSNTPGTKQLKPLTTNSQDISIIRHNFSTNGSIPTTNTPIVSANLVLQESNFLKLLWQGATLESGGYFFIAPLNQSVHDGIFNEQESITLTLLIESISNTDPIYEFHNTVVFRHTDTNFLEDNLILAAVEKDTQSPIRIDFDIPVLTIPPGFFGFQHITSEPKTEPIASSLLTSAQLRKAPQANADAIGTALAAGKTVDVLHLSKDKKWALVEFLKVPSDPVNPKERGWLLLETENPDDADGNPVPPTVHLSVASSRTQDHALAELKSLYHLLGYGVTGKPLNSNMPIGPAADPLVEDGPWTYEKLIPAHAKLSESLAISLLTAHQFREAPDATATLTGSVMAAGETVLVSYLSPDGAWAFARHEDKKGWLLIESTGSGGSKTAHLSLPTSTNIPFWPHSAPPWEQHPYRGISASQTLSIDFWWQDLYGNRISPTKSPKSFEVRYTDPLIGINQWPSINEHYQFLAGATNRELEIEFIFASAPYQGLKTTNDPKEKDALTRRLKADLSTYQKIYYQLRGLGLDFVVTSSLDANFEYLIGINMQDSNSQSMADFVLKIYEYLDAVHSNLDTPANIPDYTATPFSLRLAIQNQSDTKHNLQPKNEFIQGISVFMTMRRPQNLVHPDYKNDDKYKGIYENKATLSPKHESVEFHIPNPAPSLDSLAAQIEAALDKRETDLNLLPTNNETSATDIVRQHQLVKGTVAGGQQIQIDLLPVKDEDPAISTFGDKRKALRDLENKLLGQLDPVISQKRRERPGLDESTSRKVITFADDSLEAFVLRIEREMNRTLGPILPVALDKANFLANYDGTTTFTETDSVPTSKEIGIDSLTIQAGGTFGTKRKSHDGQGNVSRTITSIVGETFGDLIVRIEHEMNGLLLSIPSLAFTQEDFLSNFDSPAKFAAADRIPVLEIKLDSLKLQDGKTYGEKRKQVAGQPEASPAITTTGNENFASLISNIDAEIKSVLAGEKFELADLVRNFYKHTGFLQGSTFNASIEVELDNLILHDGVRFGVKREFLADEEQHTIGQTDSLTGALVAGTIGLLEPNSRKLSTQAGETFASFAQRIDQEMQQVFGPQYQVEFSEEDLVSNFNAGTLFPFGTTVQGGLEIKIDDLNVRYEGTATTFGTQRQALNSQAGAIPIPFEPIQDYLTARTPGLFETKSRVVTTVPGDSFESLRRRIDTEINRKLGTLDHDDFLSTFDPPKVYAHTEEVPILSPIDLDGLKLEIGGTFGEKRARLRGQGSTPPKITPLANETFDELISRIEAITNQILQPIFGVKYPMDFILADLAKHFKANSSFLASGASLTLTPLNIKLFAHNFSEAFPEFHLAVSEERNAGGGQANLENSRPAFLFAVKLGGSGLSYDIEDQEPNFYSIPPISTSLFSGKAELFSDPQRRSGKKEKEVEAVDANVLARDFLDILETFLEPNILAYGKKISSINTLLSQKTILAKKIANSIEPILEEDRGVNPDTRLGDARNAIHQRLLNNLLEGFDIESVIQYEATVPVTNIPISSPPPRMVGKSNVLRVRVGDDPENRNPAEEDDLDYNLSIGYFNLDPQTARQPNKKSSFTYFFDTKTPEKFGNLEMEMEFQPLEMEFNLAKFPDRNSHFQSSNKLRFILPAKLNVYRVTSSIQATLQGRFKGETEFDSFFDPILGKLIGSDYFSLKDFELALEAGLKAIKAGEADAAIGKAIADIQNNPISISLIHNQPLRRYCDALLSIANPNYMGRTTVPIPLRFYPLAPSLILQQAEIDESAREVIRDLREWRYTIIYEHPEVAQDSIDCIVRINVPDAAQGVGRAKPPVAVPEFVRLLLNVKEIRNDLDSALEALKKEDFDPDDTAANSVKDALRILAHLTTQIASHWSTIRGTQSKHYTPNPGDLHFEINEETTKFVGDTTEAEVRQGVVLNLAGPLKEDLIKLENDFVEQDFDTEPPNNEELLKMGVLKEGGNYLKNLISELELPGFLTAWIIEFDASAIEAELSDRFNSEKSDRSEAEILDEYGITDIADFSLALFSISELDKLKITKQEDQYFKHVIPDEKLPDFLVPVHGPIPDNPDFSINFLELDTSVVDTFSQTEIDNLHIIKKGIAPSHQYFKQIVPGETYKLSARLVEKEGFTAKQLIEMGIKREESLIGHFYIKHGIPGETFPPFMVIAGIRPLTSRKTDGTATPNSRTFFFAIDREDQTFFGDSSIPDRKLSIENLDLFQQQNAWGSLFLSRNKNLVFNKTTNPDFIFRTPSVRFSNRLTPSIINNEPWDVATLPLGETAQPATLEKHLENMIDLFDPGVVTVQAKHQRYELQISCRYAFTLVEGAGLNEDLVTTLPVLLGLRLSPTQLAQYPALLRKELSIWFAKHQPVDQHASLLFMVEAYSQLDPNANTSLPLLRVTNLDLKLKDILDMPEIRALDLATLPTKGRPTANPLATHLDNLLAFFKKGIDSQAIGSKRYELEVQYHFSDISSSKQSIDILSGFSLQEGNQDADAQSLHRQIIKWFYEELPGEEQAEFAFFVKVLAQPDPVVTTGLALLKEEHVKLQLSDIQEISLDLASLPTGDTAASKNLATHINQMLSLYQQKMNTQQADQKRFELEISYHHQNSSGQILSESVLDKHELRINPATPHVDAISESIRDFFLTQTPDETGAFLTFNTKVFSKVNPRELLHERLLTLTLTHISNLAEIKTPDEEEEE